MTTLALPDEADEATIRRTLSDLSLYAILHLQGVTERVGLLVHEELSDRTELTLGFGTEAEEIARSSILWRLGLTDLKIFADGWYPTLHRSYRGSEPALSEQGCAQLIECFRNVHSLNLMVDFESMLHDNLQATIEQLIRLLHHFGPSLQCLRLWTRCTMVAPVDFLTGRWSSIIRSQFLPVLCNELAMMNNIRTLWLHLEELLPGDEPERLPVARLHRLANQQELLANMSQLTDFAFASDWITPNKVVRTQLPHLTASLQSVRLLYIQRYRKIICYPVEVISKFTHLNLELDDASVGHLGRLFSTMSTLERLEIHMLQDGPRFLELFRSLNGLQCLTVLSVFVYQSSLLNSAECQELALARNKPLPLSQLTVFNIRLGRRITDCAQVSIKALFPSTLGHLVRNDTAEGTPVGQTHYPLPNLIGFDMQVDRGACRRHQLRHRDRCITRGVICCFESLPSGQLAFVRFRNDYHSVLRGEHTVQAQLTERPHWPHVLYQ